MKYKILDAWNEQKFSKHIICRLYNKNNNEIRFINDNNDVSKKGPLSDFINRDFRIFFLNFTHIHNIIWTSIYEIIDKNCFLLIHTNNHNDVNLLNVICDSQRVNSQDDTIFDQVKMDDFVDITDNSNYSVSSELSQSYKSSQQVTGDSQRLNSEDDSILYRVKMEDYVDLRKNFNCSASSKFSQISNFHIIIFDKNIINQYNNIITYKFYRMFRRKFLQRYK